ncbi:pyridoxine/pyridoxamine 5'-phosphate oxidase [Actinoplanes rectilineatus]|uniref:pyridoxine/pyridoxamine 5'-phosphate oxidase n=1 Tax=Actinoplanes rectilineatus TaxID=113571 RepID=UPI0005F2FDF3|nr:pyridoxal 5'-phosphate synthase [Actinoplanes rectilineatus]
MSIREQLRGLPVLAGDLPGFDAATTPDDPHTLFVRWLSEAVAAGVSEPHAVTLATVDADGLPDLRVLMLKEVDDLGWQFATNRHSAKGRQVAANPSAALGLHWREQARQIRVRGPLRPLDREACAADFLARPIPSRVASLAGPQSAVLGSPGELADALTRAERLVHDAPQTVAEDHTVYAISPVSIEFWQGDAERRHVRLRYRRNDAVWIKELLWP